MKHQPLESGCLKLFERVAVYAEHDRYASRPLDQFPDPRALERAFDIPLRDEGRAADDVIQDLIEFAEPGLVGSTSEGFLAWVIGGSHPAGVAADWLTSTWGQNAGIYQTSPAAASCEQVAAKWLLDLLDLPSQSAVGFVTGATMASFVCLAAARGEVLRRVGYDLDELGLHCAPRINVLLGADTHVANYAALRYLGFGKSQLFEVDVDRNGLMEPSDLRAAAARLSGPTIVIAQAGHINSGGFDCFEAIADIASKMGAWVHIDGAFGLWARSVPELKPLTDHVDRADSWAVDGHKWLQTPYDSGFAMVRDADALRRAMSKSAGYLNHREDDGRSPSDYTPELSRRARGFAVWTMLQTLGRNGIAGIVRQHCQAAQRFARACASMPGAMVLNDVVLNQVALSLGKRTQEICDRVNGTGNFFLRTAEWRGETILRVSFAGHGSGEATADDLAAAIAANLGP